MAWPRRSFSQARGVLRPDSREPSAFKFILHQTTPCLVHQRQREPEEAVDCAVFEGIPRLDGDGWAELSMGLY